MSDTQFYNVALKTAASGKATVYLRGINNTNFTTTILGLTANSDTVTNTPVINPYGFASMPDNHYYTAVVGNLGIRNQMPIVLGYTNGVKLTSPLNLNPGESGMYNSTTYSWELKLNEMRARFNGISCKIMNGNASQQLFSDILGEMIDFLAFINVQITTYNTHIHNLGGSAGGALIVTIPPLSIDTSSLSVVAPPLGGPCTVSGTTLPTAVTLAIPPTPPVPVCPTTPPIGPMTPYMFTKPIITDNIYVNADLCFVDDQGVNLL